jgi:hypothetical protein
VTDFEPYVSDPVEPAPRAALQRSRPTIVTGIVATILAAAAFLVLADRAEQDPSLEAPVETPADEAPVPSVPDEDPSDADDGG